MSKPYTCIEPKDFDKSLIRIDEPMNDETKFLNISYLKSNKQSNLYIQLPESQFCVIKPNFKYNSKREISGYYITYKSDCEATLLTLDTLIDCCNRKLKNWKKSHIILKSLKVKPVFVNQKCSIMNDELKIAFLKLNMYNGKICTKMFDKHKQKLDPLYYISKPGDVKLIIKITGLYLGDKYAYLHLRVEQIFYKLLKNIELPILFNDSDNDEENE